MISNFWKLLFDQFKIIEVVSLFTRNYHPWFDCYKNRFFDVCHSSACSLFSLIFLPLSTCFPCPWVFSHMLTMSHDLFLLCHSDLVYFTVVIIWHSFVVFWVKFVHVVSPYLTHSLNFSGILFVFSKFFDSQLTTQTICIDYWRL